MLAAGQTARLLLRPIELADAAQLQAVFPRWEIVRFLHTRIPWPYPPGGACDYIEHVALPAIAANQAWVWTLRLKSAPESIIGGFELRRGEEDNRGFWLVPEQQGRGLMTEAVRWGNDFWFETLAFPLLRVSKAAANAASRRISERTGMRLAGTAQKDYLCGRLPSEIWEMTAQEWRAWKAAHRR